MSDRTLIQGALVISMDPANGVLERGDVLIEGSNIRRVATSIDATGCEVIDASGMIAMPGMVDCHRHPHQTQFRSLAADWTLFDYIWQMIFGYGAFYSPDDRYVGTYAGALEAIDAGVTTIVVHGDGMASPEHADAAVRALKDAGIRAVLCYGMVGTPSFASGKEPSLGDIIPSPEWHYEDVRRLRKTHFAERDGLVTLGLAMNEIEALPVDFAKPEIELAREIDAARISCHVAMGASSAGYNFVERLGEAGLLDSRFLFVHGAGLSDHELALLRDAGAAVCATPESELATGLGHPVTGRALAAGVKNALGVDSVMSCRGDLFTQMRLALQTERAHRNARLEEKGVAPRQVQMGAAEVFALATTGGAAAAGLEQHIGCLAPGMQADIVLLRRSSFGLSPLADPVASVVVGANAADVDTVLIAGRLVKRDGKLIGVDVPALNERLDESRAKIVAAARVIDRPLVESKVAAALRLS